MFQANAARALSIDLGDQKSRVPTSRLPFAVSIIFAQFLPCNSDASSIQRIASCKAKRLASDSVSTTWSSRLCRDGVLFHLWRVSWRVNLYRGIQPASRAS